LYPSDADFRFALAHGIDRKGIHEWSHVIHRLKQSAPGITDRRIAWEEEEERKAKRGALRKEEAKRRALWKEEEAKREALRKEEEAVKRAKKLADCNSLRQRFGAPMALALPHSVEQVDLETLKTIVRKVWFDEEYGKRFREDDFGCGGHMLLMVLADEFKFAVAPHRSELLEYVSSLRVAANGFVEAVEPGVHFQAA
jgi:hypothetical protein